MKSINVSTVNKELMSFNILEVAVGTNAPQGGDSGHGGRTVFRLEDQASTAWSLYVSPEYGDKIVVEQPKSIEIVLGGDSEAHTFIEALEFAAQELRRQLNSNSKTSV
ncbi:hypothetical protein ACN9MH_15290 [Paenibacillus silvae]|uniref:hypothetical protein n=1 Tax=Paenibacillus silvae TaxID=1325358 RepID=UPI003CF5C7D8